MQAIGLRLIELSGHSQACQTLRRSGMGSRHLSGPAGAAPVGPSPQPRLTRGAPVEALSVPAPSTDYQVSGRESIISVASLHWEEESWRRGVWLETGGPALAVHHRAPCGAGGTVISLTEYRLAALGSAQLLIFG